MNKVCSCYFYRYDHFAVLCELLPTGLPSMALDLIATTNGYYNSSLQKEFLTVSDYFGYNTKHPEYNYIFHFRKWTAWGLPKILTN